MNFISSDNMRVLNIPNRHKEMGDNIRDLKLYPKSSLPTQEQQTNKVTQIYLGHTESGYIFSEILIPPPPPPSKNNFLPQLYSLIFSNFRSSPLILG